ncbi:MAG: ATP synthase F0 subunit B [Oscillospiraceae bacterium]|nr:ATP synthase F0 subunit B [Oscillospiraceae bacterium]
MSINISEMIWTIICFFALLFVLNTFLFKPLIRFMDERRSRIDAGLEEARRAEEAREEARQAAEESWSARSLEARHLITQGKLEDDKLHTSTVEEAHLRVAQAREEAQAAVAREESQAREEARLAGRELTETLADRLLDNGEAG